MAFLDNTGLGTVWGKIKTKFVAGFGGISSDQTSVTIKLKNGYGNDLSADGSVTLELADSTNSKAGLMSPTEKSKLAGIAAGANAYTHPSYDAHTAAAVKVGNDATGHVVIGAALTASDVGAASSSHTHGYIDNGGKMSTSTSAEQIIASGDQFLIADYSGAGVIVKPKGISFDGSTTTKALTPKGTWETFATSAPSATSTTPIMDGTATVGTETTYARGDHIHPTDTSRASLNHIHGNIQNNGAMSADSASKATIGNGDSIVIVDSSNNNLISRTSITFDGSTTTKALTQKGTFETFVQDANYVHTDNNYTTAEKTKVGYVDTGKSVTTYVSEQISSAMTGSAKYKGTVGTGGTVTTLPTTGYKAGDYYVVKTAGTYAGQACEAGDMIFCNTDYASGQGNEVWDIVQSNITAMTTAEINAICV